MPPSPALRSFPARESHKRGHSFGNEVIVRENEDDLALFKEMESRERQDFLLQSFDDVEDMLSSKPKQFSELRIGVSVPTRGASSELLNSDGEKNDYEWLLTPPETPLFPSLDDEPPPVAAASRGRPRSQPISISRSSTMEKSNRSSRGSASPNRLSPSPRSGSGTLQSRERPSSVRGSSPSPSLRSTTPSRRPSPPPRKPSSPGQRSSTPVSRRPSPVSGAPGSAGGRGTSPLRKSRGNSPSPNIRAWQSNIPGFLMDTPPNLRTSIADRPASYVRGSSPASGNSRDSAARHRRQSTSPTPSRSASSLYSHDRDQISCQSKGSAASSMDDDSDSLQSAPLGGPDDSFSKKVGSYPSNRNLGFSKKPSRIVSPGSAPKRSFDSAIRQTDHRKSQSMFRPLLSSAPSSSFYIGKSSSNYPMFSRNSSMKTSNTEGPDQFVTVAPDARGTHNQADLADCESIPCSDAPEDVFAYDKVEGFANDEGQASRDLLPDNQHLGSENMDYNDPSLSEEAFHHIVGTEVIKTSDVMHTKRDTVCDENVEICSECRRQYHAVDLEVVDMKLCPDCREWCNLETLNILDATTTVASSPSMSSVKHSEKHKQSDAIDIQVPAAQLQLRDSEELLPVVTQDDQNLKQFRTSDDQGSQRCLQEENPAVMSTAERSEEKVDMLEKRNQHSVSQMSSDMDPEGRVLEERIDLHIDLSEAAGISVLLKRSGSSKGPVFQGRNFVASPKPFENLSYTRDNENSLRSSVGYGTASASSSVDCGPIRQTELNVQRQFSGKIHDLDISGSDVTSISSLSRVSNHDCRALDLAAVSHEEYSDSLIHETVFRETEDNDLSCSKISPCEVDKEVDVMNSFPTPMGHKDTCPSISESSNSTVSSQFEDNSVSSVQHPANCIFQEIKDIQGTASSLEKTVSTQDYSLEEHTILDRNIDGVDVAEVTAGCSLSTETEAEVKNVCKNDPNLQTRDGGGLQELHFAENADNDVAVPVSEPNSADQPQEISEESNVLLDSHGGSKARSLTLEEATDAILFCSSIVHNLAYKAASIAIDKDTEDPFEDVRPTVTVLGKSSTETKDTRGKNFVPKRNPKATKTRQARVEEEAKRPRKMENDENAGEPVVRNVGVPDKVDGVKPPKLESKCNCTIM